MIAMIGTSDRLCWLAETCKILLLLLLSSTFSLGVNPKTAFQTCSLVPRTFDVASLTNSLMLADAGHDKCPISLSRSDQGWTNSASCNSWYTVE